jgi:tRNA(Ile)-lysidine synthase
LLNYADFDQQLNALRAAPHWYVAFSGGVDSTVLLHLLRDWCAARPDAPALSAIHINHGLHAQADDWQRHCEALCGALQVSFLSCSVMVRAASSPEAAAREARYRAFEDQMSPGSVLFMGHHLDDQVETFFLRLLRGAGVEGLAAMPRQRALGAGQLVRPLLDCARGEIERYAEYHGLANVEDPSNHNTALDRNFLRAELLPLLGSRWPAYRQSVARAVGHMAAAAELVAAEVGTVDTIRSAMGDSGVQLSALVTSPAEMASARLRAWLRARGCQAPDHAALLEFLRQLRVSPADGNPRLDCGAYALQRYRDGVYLVPPDVALCSEEQLSIAPGEQLGVPGVGAVCLRPAQADGLCLAPGEQVALCWRQGGERCRLPGRSGSRSLKALMQEWGVPPWWRDRLPLLYLDGELLAVGDLAHCESTRFRAAARDGEQLWKLTWERPSKAGSR